MYYTVYKIRNKINGKTYIGSHKTKNLEDGYMGSGKYLKHAIEKHGVENFEKSILHIFDNPEQMFAMEAELVNEEFLTNENTYNLKIGGLGGFDFLNTKESIEKRRPTINNWLNIGTKRFSDKYKNDSLFREKRNKLLSDNREKSKIVCQKVSDKELLQAGLTQPSLRKALVSVGISATSNGSTKRLKRLLKENAGMV